MNGIKFEFDDGDYVSVAHSFELASDLYLFFRFESPKSDCEIGIAYDQFEDGGEWYVNNGHLDWGDHELVDDVIWDKLPNTSEFMGVCAAIAEAVREFNGR